MSEVIEFLGSTDAGARSNTHSAAYWTETIRTAWQKTAQGIFDTGNALLEADKELDSDVFAALRLPFCLRTKQRFMAIARHPVLATHVSLMPPSWGTLYELTKVPHDILRAKIEDGSIHPGLERKDVAALLGKPSDEAEIEQSAPRPRVPGLLDVWPTAALADKQAVLEDEGRSGLIRLLSPALLAKLKDALIGQEIQAASTTTTLAVNLTKLLQSALSGTNAADSPLAKINAKLKASGRDHRDVLIAMNKRVRNKRRG